MILGVDGGATATKAVLFETRKSRVMFQTKALPSNAILQSQAQLRSVMLSVFDACNEYLKQDWSEVRGVALCLAGVVNERVHKKVMSVAKEVWPKTPVVISHDLMSVLHAGTPDGCGIAVISGTGASVFGRRGDKQLRAGGWGHVLGDSGSAYHIAHMGLRSIVAFSDHQGKIDDLGRRFLRATHSKTIEDLATYVSVSEKPDVAALSKCVFDAALEGNNRAKKIVKIGASLLAANVAAVARRLKVKQVPIILAGGVFERQPYYLKVFTKELRAELPWAEPVICRKAGAIGAAIWGSCELQKLSAKMPTEQAVLISELEAIRLESLPTEQRNPRSGNLSALSSLEGVRLMIQEDSILPNVLRAAETLIAEVVDQVSRSFFKGGRLIYVGAGTSGRLGVLDAAECPATFCTPPEMVQGIIAGGEAALRFAVEGAEDDRDAGAESMQKIKVSPNDVIVGIAASGRTPFVLAALEEAQKREASTVFLTCNANLNRERKRQFDVEIHLDTGPEVLTGSTRLKAGTACKMVLNMISTLSMSKIGKVKGNYMIDVSSSNLKLKARALRMLMELAHLPKEEAYQRLVASHWRLKKALELCEGSPKVI